MDYIESEATLDRLFRPTKPFPINGLKLTVRALSESERSERSLHATSRGRKLEKSLADPESDIYQYRIRILEGMDVDTLTQLLRINYASDVRREVLKADLLDYQPFPDEATEEERRQVLNEREEAKIAHEKRIEDEVLSKTDAYAKKFLEGKEREILFAMAKSQIVESLVLEEANMEFAHYTLYRAVMDEHGEQYFRSPEDVGGMPREVVFAMYRVAQEVGEIDPLKLSGRSSTA